MKHQSVFTEIVFPLNCWQFQTEMLQDISYIDIVPLLLVFAKWYMFHRLVVLMSLMFTHVRHVFMLCCWCVSVRCIICQYVLNLGSRVATWCVYVWKIMHLDVMQCNEAFIYRHGISVGKPMYDRVMSMPEYSTTYVRPRFSWDIEQVLGHGATAWLTRDRSGKVEELRDVGLSSPRPCEGQALITV